ncbi:surface-adhesin E family protein [Altericroceibacterium xinjiangense]|uniref:surface-adhesin E family protein n=1 Tax=Altericroceibacterium xinjiangense TaxID=762261 RepID=UPI000F7DBABF|nr:surface-adhesin E family protein [Altericroceibacterium xinjiangense]
MGPITIWSISSDSAPKDNPASDTAEAIPASQPVRPTGLVHSTTTEDGTLWTLEAENVSGPPSARLVWVVKDSRKNQEVSAREQNMLYLVDCETTAYQTLSAVDYDAEGNVLARYDWPADEAVVTYPPPGSIIDGLVEAACLPLLDP